MKRNTIFAAILIAFVAFTASCNKTKVISKRLAGTSWQVSSMSVDGVAETSLPDLEFSACDKIYDALCEGEWDLDSEHAEFYWQVRASNDEFELSFKEEDHGGGHDHEHEVTTAVVQCVRFSGIYTILESDKDKLNLSSTVTNGYPGQTVLINLVKK